MSVLVLTGSARTGAYTRRIGEAIADAVDGASLTAPLTAVPFFDQDLETTPPAVVAQLREQVAAADAVVVVTPEYNGAVSGLLANALEWLSRPYGEGALRGKPVVAVAASPGETGGARAAVALRTVLGNIGAELVGGPVTVAGAHDPSGDRQVATEVASLLQVAVPAAA